MVQTVLTMKTNSGENAILNTAHRMDRAPSDASGRENRGNRVERPSDSRGMFRPPPPGCWKNTAKETWKMDCDVDEIRGHSKNCPLQSDSHQHILLKYLTVGVVCTFTST